MLLTTYHPAVTERHCGQSAGAAFWPAHRPGHRADDVVTVPLDMIERKGQDLEARCGQTGVTITVRVDPVGVPAAADQLGHDEAERKVDPPDYTAIVAAGSGNS